MLFLSGYVLHGLRVGMQMLMCQVALLRESPYFLALGVSAFMASTTFSVWVCM